MSHGGGVAKVYFVLYLAVLLELLIMIVERDEAEEGLKKQNSESMKMVESILSQLYSGSGSESINTKPQDEITLPAEADMATIKEIFGTELKTSREYLIEVGVTDVTTAVKKQEGETSKDYDARVKKLLSLANVEELEYQIFYTPIQSADSIPAFQSDEYIRENGIDFMTFQNGQSFPGPNGEPWQFVGAYKLNFDKEAAYNKLNTSNLHQTLDFVPVYKPLEKVGNPVAPRGLEDSAFYYSDFHTRESAKQSVGAQKRSFIVNFEPTDRSKAGIYKLRFASQTNRVLGVAAMSGSKVEVSDDIKVNIGTVQLSVGDLKKVAKELKRKYAEIESIGDIEVLSNAAAGADGLETIRKFDANVKSAIDNAMKADNAADLVGKIKLYSYIAKLISPGQSVNFDQNRGNFDINVRVQTAKPSTAKPYISTLTDDRCFTNSKHSFVIEAGPYKGTNRITGSVRGSGATISFAQVGGTPERDKSYKLKGTIDRELPAGTYVLEYKHELSGKTEVVYDTLHVYEMGIVDEKKTSDRLSRRATYGSKIALDMLPNSRNDIPANQFKTYVTFDNGETKTIPGYKITRDNNIECMADNKKVNVKLVWVQPYSDKEVELFSSDADIKLEEPAVLAFDLSPKYTQSGNKIKIEISGVSVLGPGTGLADKNAKCTMGDPTFRDANCDVNGYSVTRQPEIVGGDAENGYVIEMEITKNSGANVKTAEGMITIPISVTAKHPTNGKTSRVDSEVMFSVDYTPSAAKTTGGGGAAKPNQSTNKKAPAPKKK